MCTCVHRSVVFPTHQIVCMVCNYACIHNYYIGHVIHVHMYVGIILLLCGVMVVQHYFVSGSCMCKCVPVKFTHILLYSYCSIHAHIHTHTYVHTCMYFVN